jgi:hypothetical protein
MRARYPRRSTCPNCRICPNIKVGNRLNMPDLTVFFRARLTKIAPVDKVVAAFLLNASGVS